MERGRQFDESYGAAIAQHADRQLRIGAWGKLVEEVAGLGSESKQENVRERVEAGYIKNFLGRFFSRKLKDDKTEAANMLNLFPSWKIGAYDTLKFFPTDFEGRKLHMDVLKTLSYQSIIGYTEKKLTELQSSLKREGLTEREVKNEQTYLHRLKTISLLTKQMHENCRKKR